MTKYSLPPKQDELDEQFQLTFGYKEGNNWFKVAIVQFIL